MSKKQDLGDVLHELFNDSYPYFPDLSDFSKDDQEWLRPQLSVMFRKRNAQSVWLEA